MMEMDQKEKQSTAKFTDVVREVMHEIHLFRPVVS